MGRGFGRRLIAKVRDSSINERNDERTDVKVVLIECNYEPTHVAVMVVVSEMVLLKNDLKMGKVVRH